jgi:hypothetical protein
MDGNEKMECDSSQLQSLWSETLEAIVDQNIALTTKNHDCCWLVIRKRKRKTVIQK